jgi:hypothetical protein
VYQCQRVYWFSYVGDGHPVEYAQPWVEFWVGQDGLRGLAFRLDVLRALHFTGWFFDASLNPSGYSWSYLAFRIGHWVLIWQPLIGSSFQ